MREAGETPRALDRFSEAATRCAGLGLIGTGLWSAWLQPNEHLIWGIVMSLAGGGLCALYLPVLRIVAFAFLFFAGLVILGGLNPFAAMDMSAAARERPGLELKQITVVLSLSALLVFLAFLIEHTRRLRVAQRARLLKAERRSAFARERETR